MRARRRSDSVWRGAGAAARRAEAGGELMAREADDRDRKRRRRKAGLRVPSDNVPRPTRSAPSAEVAREGGGRREPGGAGAEAVSVPAAGGPALPVRPADGEVRRELPGGRGGAPAGGVPDAELAADNTAPTDARADAAADAGSAPVAIDNRKTIVMPTITDEDIEAEGEEAEGEWPDVSMRDDGRGAGDDEDEDDDEDDVPIDVDLDAEDGATAGVAAVATGAAAIAGGGVANPQSAPRAAAAVSAGPVDLRPNVGAEPGPLGTRTGAAPAPVAPPAFQADAAAQEAAAEAIGGTVEPGDASDSGELLTDDLIEEFDAGAMPEPAATAARPGDDGGAPPDAAPDRGADRDGTAAAVPAPSGRPVADAEPAAPARAETILEPVEELEPADVVEVDEPAGVVEGDEPAGAGGEPAVFPPPAPAASAPPAQAAPPPRPPAPPPRVAAAPTAAPPKPPPAPVAVGTRGGARKAKPWFEEIFDEDYLRTLPFLTPRETQRQAAFVVDALSVPPGAHLLDLGCGYGRHAMELAARGYHVVGLDLSLPLLIRGADEAQRRGLTINFVHGDMRELTFENQFDGAYCLFSTFGYFDDETNKKTAAAVARALKPGGRFVVEVLNRDYLIADLPSRVWWEGDGCVVLEEVEFNYFSSRIVSSRSVVFDDGRQLEQEISMRAYSLHEFGKLLHAAGFRVIEISGSMDTRGRFFGAHSRELVVVCEKRGPRGDGEEHTKPGTGG
ncbi:MAG: class I SAM-dependent methyltransferase [Deltaproteobacteria bacterium]|nr:MAG: class I SAM-dependent methyltransferase [Deltaproteobacteria bacterium]